MLSIDKRKEFDALQTRGKKLAAEGRLQESLKIFEEAKKICATPKVLQRIEKLKSCLMSATDSKLEVKQKSQPEPINNEMLKVTTDSQDLNSLSSEKPVKNLQKETAFESSTKIIDKKHWEVLYEEARDLAINGRCQEALEALEKAQSIHKTEKAQKQIARLKEFLKEETESNEGDERIQISSDFFLYHKVYHSLYPYQREGVAWLYNLYKMRKGGVLADDMGLGKTFQVIAFLSGMIDAELAKHVLIVMPVSLLKNWETEFKKWCPGIAITDFHGNSKKIRERNCLRVQKWGHVLLTTYGMILNNVDELSTMNGREFVWDYLILDEGHKIKNASKTTKAVHDLPSRNRIVLTGTPIQNNLKELWSLFDFVHQGTLLGSLKTFKTQYENPIIRSREKDATSGEKLLGSQISENLKHLISPYFIRRTKSEIWNKELNKLENQMENMMISMPKKNDFILWTFISQEQIQIYKSFLHSDAVKEILVSKRSPLVELTCLKKICDHPRLLSQRACLQLGLGSESEYEENPDEHSASPSIDGVTDDMLLEESGKLKVALALIEHLKETGHKTLFFSLSRKILDMVQRILLNRNFKLMRLDGTVSKTEERERRIQKFQRDPSYSVFLLTTQVGGVGINLTAADRVIIYDPSWNPATDAQAVDRVFRIGQKKNVIVYRLITCGTVEEKIYRRQIFKDSITRQTTGDSEPYRYFSKQELRELFTFEDPYHSVTQAHLHQMHSAERQTDEDLLKHIEFLETLNIFGISDHDLMFSKEVQDHTEDDDETAISRNFINAKVASAAELIKKEASITAEGIRVAGTFSRPYQEPVVVTKKSSKVTEWYKPPVLPEESDNKKIDEPEIFTKMRNSLEVENFDAEQQKPPLFKVPPEIRNSFDEYCANQQQNFPGFEVPLKLRNSLDEYNCGSNIYNPEEASSSVLRERNETLFLEEINDLELTASKKKNGRRISCARLSGVVIAEESDDSTSLDSEEDSFNSASISFVPDSASSSRQSVKSYESVSEILMSPKILVGDTELDNHKSNVKRITPLKVNKNFIQENSFFEQAMASSIVITPQASPDAIQDISFQHVKEQSFQSLGSPIHFRKKIVRQISSDSEESEVEGTNSVETGKIENNNSPLPLLSKRPGMLSDSGEETETEMKKQNVSVVSSEEKLTESRVDSEYQESSSSVSCEGPDLQSLSSVHEGSSSEVEDSFNGDESGSIFSASSFSERSIDESDN